MPHAFRVSEVFLSLQGEGPSAGTPAHFLRLQGCSVGCHWCDTRYSWPRDGGKALDGLAIQQEARALGDASMVVITGGEPLEQPGLADLIRLALEHWSAVEVETSGIAPPPLSHPRLAWNVSPKLPSATPRWRESWHHVGAWIDEPRATFKIVVGDPPDAEDVRRLAIEHGLPRERVMLMPEGLTDEAIRRHAVELVELCKREGWRLSPRLQVWMWGARRGV